MIVRDATYSDIRAISDVMADAFQSDDPVADFIFPDEARRLTMQRRMIAALVRHRHLPGRTAQVAVVNGRVVGASLWHEPNSGSPVGRALSSVLSGPHLLWAMHSRIFAGMAIDAAIESAAPTEPHIELVYLGCLPSAQSTGVGSALVRSLTNMLDARGLALYGVCKAENITYYEQFGCAITGTVQVGRGGPPLTTMTRPAAGC